MPQAGPVEQDLELSCSSVTISAQVLVAQAAPAQMLPSPALSAPLCSTGHLRAQCCLDAEVEKGGHINPAVSLAMCVTGRLKWTKLPIYILAQLLGAFVGAAAVFGIYYNAFMEYSDGKLEVTGPNATAQIFATYPAPYLSLINGFADQVMSTAVLLLAIFAIFDTKNNSVPKGLEPIAVGLLIIVLTCSLGMNSGCAMNPARDLGPRLFTAVAGWGMEVFTAGNNWWWVPIVAPLLGGVLGAMIYVIFIEIHHSDPQSGEENEAHAKYELTNMA
uniref:Aquaporin 9 n=1 Tax=Corvus moneduloides TaxID=1196302 RepID=A0A8U7P9H4_CORMO